MKHPLFQLPRYYPLLLLVMIAFLRLAVFIDLKISLENLSGKKPNFSSSEESYVQKKILLKEASHSFSYLESESGDEARALLIYTGGLMLNSILDAVFGKENKTEIEGN